VVRGSKKEYLIHWYICNKNKCVIIVRNLHTSSNYFGFNCNLVFDF